MNFLANSTFWSILASISTVLGFAVVILTPIMALKQLKEMTRNTHKSKCCEIPYTQDAF